MRRLVQLAPCTEHLPNHLWISQHGARAEPRPPARHAQEQFANPMNTVENTRSSLLKRTVRFGATGLFITALHVAIATLFVNYVLHDSSIANGVAFCIATIASYLMHTKWSFSSQVQRKTFVKFMVVSAFGLGLSLGIPLIVNALGFNYIVATLAVVFVLPVTNFVLHNFWTYR